MDTNSTILITLDNRHWTIAALQRACAMARAASVETTVTLLHLMPVQHLAWLGTEFGLRSLSRQEQQILDTCSAIASNYGVTLVLQPMQYVSYVEAVVEAANLLNASAVFARVQASLAPLRSLQRWQLQRALGVLWVNDEEAQTAPVWVAHVVK